MDSTKKGKNFIDDSSAAQSPSVGSSTSEVEKTKFQLVDS